MHDPAPPTAPPVPDRRHLPLPGTWNVRDVGGYPAEGGTTRWGTLLRSETLHRLEPAGRARLAGLGLRTIIDLREPAERQAMPDALDGLAVRVHLEPVATSGGFDLSRPVESEELYRRFVDDCGTGLTGAVAALTRPGALPALVHCTAGKDRTGLVIALALTAVGVEEPVVIQDYTLTNQYFTEPLRAEARRRLAATGLSPEIVESALGCPPELLAGTLAHIRAHHGGVHAYLKRHGLDDAGVDALRSALVEPA